MTEKPHVRTLADMLSQPDGKESRKGRFSRQNPGFGFWRKRRTGRAHSGVFRESGNGATPVRFDEVKQKERRVDALALRADEGRDKLRKAAGRSKYPVIRGCPNGETCCRRPAATVHESIVCGREPAELKHLSRRRKRKQQ